MVYRKFSHMQNDGRYFCLRKKRLTWDVFSRTYPTAVNAVIIYLAQNGHGYTMQILVIVYMHIGLCFVNAIYIKLTYIRAWLRAVAREEPNGLRLASVKMHGHRSDVLFWKFTRKQSGNVIFSVAVTYYVKCTNTSTSALLFPRSTWCIAYGRRTIGLWLNGLPSSVASG